MFVKEIPDRKKDITFDSFMKLWTSQPRALKGAAKLYFMYYLREVIILFITG